MSAKRIKAPTAQTGIAPQVNELVVDIRTLIEEARSSVATVVNAGLTLLYWQIGKRVRIEVLNDMRADYGKEIVSTLSRQLVCEYGRGFSANNLRRMAQFSEVFPDSEMVATLSRQLSGSHFKELYLRWLKKYECRPEEKAPLGIILCAGKKSELIELLELKQSGIHVAQYLIGLPPRELLEKKLHQAVETARARFAERTGHEE